MRFFLALLGLTAALVAEPPKELSDKQKLEVARFQAGLSGLQLDATRRIEKLKADQEAELRRAIEAENRAIERATSGFGSYLDSLRKELGLAPDCLPDAKQTFVCPAKAEAKK